MIRVLFLTHRLPYAPNRGDRIRTFHMLHALRGQAEVDLISLVHDDEEARHGNELSALVSSVGMARVSRARNLAPALVSLPTTRPLTHTLLASPDMPRLIAEAVRERRPDVVFAYCSGMAQHALESPLREIPCVLDMVDVDSEKWRRLGETASFPKRWIYAREAKWLGRFEAEAVRHSRVTLVVNERERDALAAIAPGATIETVLNGVDLASFTPPGRPANHPRVVFCGVMNYEPNEQAAIFLARDVWPLVRAVRPDATLALVGSGPTAAVRGLADQSAGITVTGAVPEVRAHLWDAAVAAAPLFTARGVQNKVLEAVAAGLPVVVTPAVLEGLPIEVQPAVRAAVDAPGFAAALLAMLAQSPDERRAVATSADLRALNWAVRLKGLSAILERAARS